MSRSKKARGARASRASTPSPRREAGRAPARGTPAPRPRTEPEEPRHDRPDRTRAGRKAPVEEGRRQRLDRLGARILRLLHLRDRRRADLPADLLPLGEPARRDHRLARHLRRRLRRPPDRRLRARPLGRHPRPQAGADPLHVPDGLLDPRRRVPAHLPAGRPARAGAPRHPAPDPGLCRRRRDLRRLVDDPRARAVRTPRLLRQLHAAGRAGRPDPRRRGLPAAGALHARGGLQQLGLAHPVPAQLRRDHRRLDHPPRGRRDPGLQGGRQPQRRAEARR